MVEFQCRFFYLLLFEKRYKILQLKNICRNFVCLFIVFFRVYFYVHDIAILFSMYFFSFQLYDLFHAHDVMKHFEHSKEFDEFGLLLKKWAILKELVRILAIPYEATVELQRRDLTLSDTYGIFIKMELHLESKTRRPSKSGLEFKLLDKLKDRKQTIFSNQLMKAALFLDPRFRRQITRSSDDTEEAKQVLLALSRRLIVLSESLAADNMNHTTESANTSDDNFDAQKAFEQYYNTTNNNDCTVNQSDIEAILDSFDPPPLTLNASVLDYWHSSDHKQHSQSLFDVAMAIFAVPPTEVDIERDFSTLKFI